PRRRGVRRLADSDTGTCVQPSLFPPPTASGSGNSIAPQGESSNPQHPQPAVDNSASLHQPKEIRIPETVSHTVSDAQRLPDTGSDTVADTNRSPDPGSRIPEDLISSGEGDRGGGARPVLTLVPPFTAAEVIRELSHGKWDPAFDRSHQNALSAMIPVWVADQVTLADIALLREYSAISGQRMSARWLVGCDLASEISKARRTLDLRDVRARVMADSL